MIRKMTKEDLINMFKEHYKNERISIEIEYENKDFLDKRLHICLVEKYFKNKINEVKNIKNFDAKIELEKYKNEKYIRN